MNRFLKDWPPVLNIAKFALPFAIWIFFFRHLVLGQTTFLGDGDIDYGAVRFFLENFFEGVFPLWNPYSAWGCPDLIVNNLIGVFNPLWMLVAALRVLGMPYYLAFVWVSVFYFFIGITGFYFLAKALLKDPFAAYLGFLMMLFSTQGIYSNMPNAAIIYTPMVWFFYFWIRFCEEPCPKFFVGLVFLLMIIASSYFPPYWMTVWTFLFLASLAVDREGIVNGFRAGRTLVRRHAGVAVACVVLGVMIIVPVVKAFQLSAQKEVVFIDRQGGDAHSFLSKGGEVTPGQILADSVNLRMLPRQLFAHLDLHGYWKESIFIPIGVFLLLLLSGFNPTRRRHLVLFCLLVLLFFVLLGPMGKVYMVFYRLLPFFAVIHSLSCFWLAFTGVLIIFCLGQWQQMVQEGFHVRPWVKCLILFLVHGGFLAFLLWQGNNLVSSYITILLSFGYFCLLFLFGGKIPGGILPLIFLFGMTIQPLEGLWHYSRDYFRDEEHIKKYVLATPATKDFSYVRPEAQGPMTRNEDMRYKIERRDSIKFMGLVHFPSRWTAYLSSFLPEDVIENYVRYKFYLYDHVMTSTSSAERDLQVFETIARESRDLALIADTEIPQGALGALPILADDRERLEGQAEILRGPSEAFRVTHFDVNSIEIATDFPREKFLVYTDSHHRDWKLWVNGQRAVVYRANLAFKGIYLPPGKNVIRLAYLPLGGARVYFGFWVVVEGMFFWTVFLFLSNRGISRQKIAKT